MDRYEKSRSVLLSLGFGERIGKWRINKKSAELENGYFKTISEQKESYSNQLNKLQELLRTESIDELTYERMKNALDDNYVKKRGEANAQRARAEQVEVE